MLWHVFSGSELKAIHLHITLMASLCGSLANHMWEMPTGYKCNVFAYCNNALHMALPYLEAAAVVWVLWPTETMATISTEVAEIPMPVSAAGAIAQPGCFSCLLSCHILKSYEAKSKATSLPPILQSGKQLARYKGQAILKGSNLQNKIRKLNCSTDHGLTGGWCYRILTVQS